MGRNSLLLALSLVDVVDVVLPPAVGLRYLRAAFHTLDDDQPGIPARTLLDDTAIAMLTRITAPGEAPTRSDLVVARRWRDHAISAGLLRRHTPPLGGYAVIVDRAERTTALRLLYDPTPTQGL
ncbi:hypothetical protein [Agromyces sp. Marseille-Q5079]|uniref:hypothetical protein n=1 Tax=Agromyces sp. Marseille-Q5079 TaxID=3439059 RepID=UPI003D9CA341